MWWRGSWALASDTLGVASWFCHLLIRGPWEVVSSSKPQFPHLGMVSVIFPCRGDWVTWHMVKHLVSIITCERKIRDHFMLFSFSQTFLFSLNELVVLKPFFEGSITDFIESLMDVLDCLPGKYMFTPNHIQFQRIQAGPSKAPCLWTPEGNPLRRLWPSFRRDTALSSLCPRSLAEAGVHGAALPEDWGMGFLFLLHSIC